MAPPLCDPENYQDAIFAFYRFAPSVGANIIFVILFGLSTLLHTFQMWKTKTWYLWPLVVGGACEAVGYIGRAVNAHEDEGCWTIAPYVIQNLLILLGPAFMAASIYMILGRIILLTAGEHLALVKRKWLTKIFVWGDVLSLMTQSTGGSIMVAEDLWQTGEKVIIAGLFIQLFIFSCFLIIATNYHYRLARLPTPESTNPNVRWKWYLFTLYLTGGLILVRSLFRVVEFIEGNHGPLMRKEVYIFIFDGLPMVIVLLWMNWFHPGEIGLLLRNEVPITNGLQLMKIPGYQGQKRCNTMESLVSNYQ
ncbi:RTA1 like protein-domain-containing protein [Aspergillus karnatakaensis]|uniref:RTA1 domain-containing protein n=1 Tax=Aspergillus karnatakaensis TaxID=1810916 RepID=UPI003CCD5292